MYMKYLRNYNQYKINEGWLGNKTNEWDNDTKVVMVDFIKPFKDIIKNIKDWKTTINAEKVKIDIMRSIETSFNTLNNNLKKVKKPETLYRIYDDITQMIILLNDIIVKELDVLKESIESTTSGLKLVINGILGSIKDEMSQYKSNYIDSIQKKENIDDKRVSAISIFDKIFDKIKTSVKSINVDVLMVRGEDLFKGNKDKSGSIDLKPDEKVKYIRKNGEENIGIVATNQENLSDNIVNLRSEDGNDTFTIDKSQVIEILNDQDPSTIKKSISNELDYIDDDIKLRRIKDLMDDLSDKE